jgi:hypothetical protein
VVYLKNKELYHLSTFFLYSKDYYCKYSHDMENIIYSFSNLILRSLNNISLAKLEENLLIILFVIQYKL